ncbi:MAG: ABC transporter ATP-binding protein [Bacteroidales bacterium]|nr:ABC transporter ATP-binding protein [Bacteroidales bacterium]MBO7647052.1 ABC transporter ATP-binding protein [Bacteroidales bacterium]
MDALLKIEDLSLDLKQDGEWKSILRHVTFEVGRGETIGIVGESGSGKSVTALSVMQLLNRNIARYPSGRILFCEEGQEEGTDLLKLTEKEMRSMRGRRVAMIFQEPMTSLNPVIRCGEQITEQLLLHTHCTPEAAKARVIELFNEVMLPRPEQIFQSYPHELSGGQKQRVMIAMAMSCQPDVLIADEPTTALDVTVQKGILDLIKRLQKKHGMSVFFITHDLGVVAEIARKVVVLFKGEVVEQGDIRDIFLHPQHPYTQGLLACRPSMTERLVTLPTVDDFVSHDGQVPRQQVTPEERNKKHQQLYSAKPLITIRGLSKRYPVRKEKLFEKRRFVEALQDINLDIYEGETLGLVGESGCGKTTLGRSMIRLIEPTAGSVTYQGRDLMKLSSRELRSVRKDLQIILQDPYSSLNQRLTIGDMLTEPMRVHGIGGNEKERRSKAIALLERVSLNESHFYRYPHEFSGGQRQRISIARALAVNPRFIICDESVSALDVSVQAQVLNLLNELKNEYQFTYIFISHDLSVVRFMSDRIAVMQQGRIVELGEADELCRNPQTDYTRTLLNAIPQGIRE